MTNGTKAPAPWLAALWRFLRVGLIGLVLYIVDHATGFLSSLHLPFWLLPLATAALNALSKWIRDKWGVDLKIV